jgi:Fe-S-cluster containining protein
MDPVTAPENSNRLVIQAAADGLACLYESMDAAYRQAAESHGFVCAGCDDNCCRSRFYHHTLAEHLYLRQGLKALPAAARQRVRQCAVAAIEKMRAADDTDTSMQVMCPLNEAGRCSLYAHRPMICRLHGIPHQLRRPDGRGQAGPGCADFDRQCGACSQPILDRTPLYAALAELEKGLRRRLGVERKIRMTIAQMVVEGLVLPYGPEENHEVY